MTRCKVVFWDLYILDMPDVLPFIFSYLFFLYSVPYIFYSQFLVACSARGTREGVVCVQGKVEVKCPNNSRFST